ncbi:MAG: SRPBCC domain-containing protein [Thermoanaerobaculia bacterium]|nr:SRPBCC domain-containing protein [Thermoanaerobaculia bacterium]
MSRPDFAYAIYIRASREEVWQGLLEPEFTRQYWFHDHVSDWRQGARWEMRQSGSEAVSIAGEVLEIEPHERLVLSWAKPEHLGEPGRTSRLTITLNEQDWPGGPWTGVILEHTDFGDDHEMRDSVSGGWPMILSGLKTLLESGLDA